MPALGEKTKHWGWRGLREKGIAPGNTHRVDSESGTPVKTGSRFRYRAATGTVSVVVRSSSAPWVTGSGSAPCAPAAPEEQRGGESDIDAVPAPAQP